MTQLTMRLFAIAAPGRPRSEGMGPIVGGLPRLDELFEAGARPGQEISPERQILEEKLRREGVTATAEYLLEEMRQVYRLQAVLVDDKHFEVVLRQMLDKVRIAAAGDAGLEVDEIVGAAQLEAANAASSGKPASAEPVIVGVTEAASLAQDFIAAAISFGGIPALARAASRGQRVELAGIRSCTAFGKVIPAKSSI